MKKWLKPPINSTQVRTVANAHNLDLLSAAILTRRNIVDSERIAFFLEEDERYLHNPFLFPQMETAVERVLMAAEEGEKVLVCGDRDADGITSTALMIETLKSIGIDAQWRVPVGDEHYGINPEVLKTMAAEDVSLIITVDCGISDFKEVELAKSLGMDVLIFDHHMPQEERIPDALAIVNPKMSENYPFTGLCAVAVVSKFQWALCLAGTELWGEEFCLVYAEEIEKEDKSQPFLVLEAIRMRHLVEVQRIRVEETGGIRAKEKFLRFIEGQILFVYNRSEQVPLISRFFDGAEVHVVDIASELAAVFPVLKNRSFTELKTKSRMTQYFPEKNRNIDVFSNLVITLYCKKLCSAFDSWRQGLDMVALGTISDIMPLVDENRILVRLGLQRLNGTDDFQHRRIAFRELLIRQNLVQGSITTVETSWRLSPLINAPGRMGQANLGVELFLADDPVKISALADKLVVLNKERRALGEKFWNHIQPDAYKSLENMNNRMSIVVDEDIPRGITGILANRLQNTLGKSAVVISQIADTGSGSIRCGNGLNAMTWLHSMASLFDDFGGHPQAGGFRLSRNKVSQLIEKSRDWVKANFDDTCEQNNIVIDAELSHKEFNKLGEEGLHNLLKKFEPYGEGFQPFIFLTKRVHIHNAELMGKIDKKHLKLSLSLGDTKWPAIWWNAAERYGDWLRIDENIDLVYHFDVDSWRGANALRLTILEAVPCVKQQ